jgi:hypothetical protein
MKKRIYFFYLLIFMQINTGFGQEPMDKFTTSVSSIDSIIFNLYDVISGDAGVERDWELFHHLFLEEAKLIPTGINSKGEGVIKIISPKEYQEKSGPYLVEKGFLEKEIYRLSQQFGNIAQVFSTYESFHSSIDPEPFDRGINSIQLFYDQSRWWIVNIAWTPETEKLPIPSAYLPDK